MQETHWKKYVHFPTLYVALKSVIVFCEVQSAFIVYCYTTVYDLD